MKRLFIVLAVIGGIMFITCLAIDAPPLVYFVLIGILVFVGFLTAPIFKQADELKADGKIINRDPSFVESAQIFTLSSISKDTLVTALKNEGLPFNGLEWKTSGDSFGFSYNRWTAQMVKLDCEATNLSRYKFSFTGWQTMSHGTIIDIMQMNQLLTAIEKAFIKLDQNTKVKTERIKVNTNSSIF
jgi:hypothetical protein